MIALQTLKYKIFEWCLDTFMDKLSNNFRTNVGTNGLTRVDLKDLHPGMLIAEIWIIIDHNNYKGIWRGCRIEDIIDWNPTTVAEVWFTWSSHRDNINNRIEYPPLDEDFQGLSPLQIYDQDVNGVNSIGITVEFYI